MAGPKPGDAAPPFELPDTEGNPRTLDEFRGRALVLFFYPADFTPGCTKEACTFRDLQDDFDARGAAVVGISRDAPGKHAEFKGRYRLAFPLLADEDGSVTRRYGATGLLGRRTTFVIGPDGRVVRRIASPLPGPHVRRALDALEEAAR